MSLRILQNRYIPRWLGMESGRRWASMNLAIMLGLGLQVHYDANQMAANASTGANSSEGTAERSDEPTKFSRRFARALEIPANQRFLRGR
jgi:hypothetical protein